MTLSRNSRWFHEAITSGWSGYYFEDPANPGTAAPGAPAAAGTPGSPAVAAVPGTPGSPAAGDPGTARTGAAATGFTYQEDRSKWIPPHRLNEVSTARTTAEQRATTLTAELAAAKAQVAALAGVNPQDPQAMKSQEVKAAFEQLFPHLKPLLSMSAEQIEALTRTPDAAHRATQNELRQWQRHGNQQMATVYADVAEAMGVEKLDADAQSDLKDSFTKWLKSKAGQELQASNGEESATITRYEEGDATLLKEFATAYTKRWVEPARRTATSLQIPRTRPTPNSQGRTQVTTVQRPEKFASLDDRLDYAAKLAKERGVQFGQ